MDESQGNAKNGTIADLYNRLDTLWIQYLQFLDEYTSAQEAIKTHLSAGFLSLAKANFQISGGRRYGQDYYDQRAVASARVALSRTEKGQLRMEIVKSSPEGSLNSKQDGTDVLQEEEAPLPSSGSKDIPKTSSTTQLPSPSPTPEPDTAPGHLEEKEPSENEENLNEEDKEPIKPPPIDHNDPLRQFGILIPPALRTAHKSFSTAVLDPKVLSQAVQAARLLREVEVEIRRARKGLRKAEKLIGAGNVGDVAA